MKTLRTSLPLAIILCVVLWYAMSLKMQTRAAAKIEKLGGSVAFSEPFGLVWLNGYQPVTSVSLHNSQATDAWLDENLKGMDQLQRLNLSSTSVTDAGLERLLVRNQVQILCVDFANVTDNGLEKLKGQNKLNVLTLSGTKVTDDGLKHLRGLNQLRQLELKSTKISDAGLENLKGLNNLHFLFLSETKVSDEGVKKLQQAMPSCMVKR